MHQAKKLSKITIFLLPYLIGVFGFYVAGDVNITDALFYSFSFYTLNYLDAPPNIFVEIARWTAPLMTVSGLLLAVAAMRARLRDWLTYIRGGSIAVYGEEEETAHVLEELGSRGICVKKRLPKAERYILLADEQKNFLFYQKYRKELSGKTVYLKCSSMNGRETGENLKLFSEEEIAARIFWKNLELFKVAERKNYRLKIVFAEFGPLEQQLLLWGLQNNIFHAGQCVEYHIFATASKFQCIYHELKQMEDIIVFHDEPWYEQRKLLLAADYILVSDTSGILSDILFAIPEKPIHVFARSAEDTLQYEDQTRLHVFYWKQEAEKIANILDEVLLIRAKSINLRYAHLYSGVEETAANREAEWAKLDTFTKYSNISSADYHEVRLQMLAAWKKETGKQKPDAAFLDRLAELEHIRWCRYHYLNNWKYGIPENGKNKDIRKRIHKDLVPYQELTEGEKEKDRENIRILLSVEV